MFFKKRAVLEDEYGRNLQKLARSSVESYAISDCKAGSFVGAWQTSLKIHEIMSENRIKFAQRLNEMADDLATLAKEVDKNRKQVSLLPDATARVVTYFGPRPRSAIRAHITHPPWQPQCPDASVRLLLPTVRVGIRHVDPGVAMGSSQFFAPLSTLQLLFRTPSRRRTCLKHSIAPLCDHIAHKMLSRRRKSHHDTNATSKNLNLSPNAPAADLI